jgi:hypothetical protein
MFLTAAAAIFDFFVSISLQRKKKLLRSLHSTVSYSHHLVAE